MTEKNSICPLCGKRIPRRVTYLYNPALQTWVCKDCWSVEVNSIVAWNDREEAEHHHNAT